MSFLLSLDSEHITVTARVRKKSHEHAGPRQLTSAACCLTSGEATENTDQFL